MKRLLAAAMRATIMDTLPSYAHGRSAGYGFSNVGVKIEPGCVHPSKSSGKIGLGTQR